MDCADFVSDHLIQFLSANFSGLFEQSVKLISCLHRINIHYGECTNDFIAYFKVGKMGIVTFLYIFYGGFVWCISTKPG